MATRSSGERFCGIEKLDTLLHLLCVGENLSLPIPGKK